MERKTYLNLQRELSQEGCFEVGNLRSLLLLVMELSLGAFLLWLGAGDHALVSLGAGVLLGFSLFRLFALQHEAGHGTLFRGRWANTMTGLLLSPATLLPVVPWIQVHNAHHVWVGIIDLDPTQAQLLKLKSLSRLSALLLRVSWKCGFPLMFLGSLVRTYWAWPWTRSTGKKRWLGAVSLLWVFMPHALLWWSLGSASLFLCVASMYLVYATWFENMNFSQHAELYPHLSSTRSTPIPLYEQDVISRTLHLPRWLGVVTGYNFHFHVVHHLFPALPWRHLSSAHSAMEKLSPGLAPSASFFPFVRSLRRRDGLDIYAGSLPEGGHCPSNQPQALK